MDGNKATCRRVAHQFLRKLSLTLYFLFHMSNKPEPLSLTQLNNLQQFISNGDLHGFYKRMENSGYEYAGWADGVASGNSIAGIAATDFLKGTALMGAGGRASQNLSSDQINAIKKEMAQVYLDTLTNIATEGGGSVSRDVNASETWDFHKTVFENNGLGIENWTLDAPFQAMRKLRGDAGVEAMWDGLRETGGSGPDALIRNSEVLYLMEVMKDSPDPAMRKMATEWLGQVPGIYDGGQMLRSVKNVLDLAKLMAPDANNLTSTPYQPGRGLWPGEIEHARDIFDKARKTVSPLVLDLDGNGISTVSAAAGVHFDHDGNNFSELTGWVSGGDGLLVLDRNGNGTIDSGRELFGNQTRDAGGNQSSNGFEALEALDDNQDHRIDAADKGFNALRVWIDKNYDGRSTVDELHTLNELHIQSLSTSYANTSGIDDSGNEIRQQGTYSLVGGQTHVLADVWFKTDLAITVQAAQIAVSDEIAALPDFAGSGNVPTLHQAMAMDDSGEIKKIVKEITKASSSQLSALVDSLLLNWTGALKQPTETFIQKYAVEQLLGEAFGLGQIGPNQHDKILDTYVSLRKAVELKFIDILPEIQSINKLVRFDLDSDTLKVKVNVDAVKSFLSAGFLSDPASMSVTLENYGRTLDAHAEAGQLIAQALAQGEAGDDFLVAISNAQTEVHGYGGNDTLVSVGFASILEGGRGNDEIYSGKEDNIFLFNKGDGQDRIHDTGGFDKIIFGPGISSASDVELLRVGADLVVKIKSDISSEVDQVTVVNWYGSAENSLESMVFSDGVIWDRTTIADHVVTFVAGTAGDDTLTAALNSVTTIYGFAGNDSLTGGNMTDTLDGGDGDDALTGGAGNDVLIGGAGNDTLNGGVGSDILVGGKGNDVLTGEGGSDTYRLAVGDGLDRIVDAYTDHSTDVLEFTDLASTADIVLHRQGGDLVIDYGSGDQVTVAYQLGGSDEGGIEKIMFSDGVSWDRTTIAAHVVTSITGTAGDDTLTSPGDVGYKVYGLAGNDTLNGGDPADMLDGGDGNDTLAGFGGNDVLLGGAGNDTLNGGVGNDILVGGKGNDVLIGERGSDTYRLAVGDGLDRIVDAYTDNSTDVLEFTDLASTADIV
ncbi:calcium-binding protein, partial [Duganella sp. HH101]|uniref:calcium-binding protein n=1 Tax=Duganella sp. HH101 TaxID=1781066 RepID=UPI0025708D04